MDLSLREFVQIVITVFGGAVTTYIAIRTDLVRHSSEIKSLKTDVVRIDADVKTIDARVYDMTREMRL